MKTEPLNLKVLPEHKLALHALANLEGEPMSVILRRLIRQEAQKLGVWPDTSHEIAKVGGKKDDTY